MTRHGCAAVQRLMVCVVASGDWRASNSVCTAIGDQLGWERWRLGGEGVRAEWGSGVTCARP